MLSMEPSLTLLKKYSNDIDNFIKNTWRGYFIKLFHQQDLYNKALLQKVNLAFIALEKSPIKIYDEHLVYSKVRQQKKYHKWLNFAKFLVKKNEQTSSSNTLKEVNLLRLQMTALKYRLKPSLKSQPFKKEIFDFLKRKALAWKASNSKLKNKSLTEVDLKKLQKLCSYPTFIKQLKQDNALCEEFLTWVITHGNDIEPFIEFPLRVKKIISSKLSTRLGFNGGQDLSIEIKPNSKNVYCKDLTLPFEGKKISILDDEKSIELSNKYTLKLKSIFDIFREKDLKMGNLEYFPTLGICNWHSGKLQKYNPTTASYSDVVDLSKSNWYDDLHPMESLSSEKASCVYEDKNGHFLNCNGIDWIFTIIGTNEDDNPGLIGTHGYLQIAIPTREKNYNIYDFGKYATEYPTNFREKLRLLVDVVEGCIQYPDENRYQDRYREGISFLVKPEIALQCMESLRKDLQQVKQKKFFFQILNQNCIQWVFKKLKSFITFKEIQAICGIHFQDIRTSGPLGLLLKVTKKFPPYIQANILDTIAKMLSPNEQIKLSKKGLKRISLTLKDRPWSVSPSLNLHPGVLILRKRSKKNI